MSLRVTRVDEIPVAPTPIEDGLEWHPVRNHLGITAFGTNAYVGRAAGDLVIEDHDEDEHEELYVVLAGTARFTVDGETFDAPQGTPRPPRRRHRRSCSSRRRHGGSPTPPRRTRPCSPSADRAKASRSPSGRPAGSRRTRARSPAGSSRGSDPRR